MPTSVVEIHVPNAESVTITEDALTVALSDGRTLSVTKSRRSTSPRRIIACRISWRACAPATETMTRVWGTCAEPFGGDDQGVMSTVSQAARDGSRQYAMGSCREPGGPGGALCLCPRSPTGCTSVFL